MPTWTTSDQGKPFIQDQATTVGTNWGDFYGGFRPSTPYIPEPGAVMGAGTVQNPMMTGAPYKPSYLTPAQLAVMDAVPDSSWQAPRPQPLRIPGEAYGSSFPDTGNKGRATPDMRQQLAINGPGIRPQWTIPAPAAVTPAAWGPFEQANLDARTKPGTWLDLSRNLAQVGFRQAAIQKNYPLPPPAPAPVKTPWGQMSQQLFQQLLATQQPAAPGKAPTQITVRGGKTTPAQNYSLANALGAVTKQGATGTGTNGYTYSNGQKTGVAPQYAGMSPSQMYDAINARAGNPTSSGNSSSLTSMGSSPQEGGTPDWVAHARPLYDSQGNISGYAKNVR